MEIEYFINFIQGKQVVRFSRGQIIDYIADNHDDWVMALKALIIKTPKKYIYKYYVLEKLNFMKRHPSMPYEFLDYEGKSLFTILRQI